MEDKETFAIIGAAMTVHKELGHGFLEAVYQDSLEIEFKKNNIPYEREKHIPIYYKDECLKTYYKADFVCYDSIIVELKAIKNIGEIEYAQTLNYLKATKNKRAIIINFANRSLQYKRMVLDYKQ